MKLQAPRHHLESKAGPPAKPPGRQILNVKPMRKRGLADKENPMSTLGPQGSSPQPDLIRDIIEREINKQHAKKRQQERRPTHTKSFEQIVDPCLLKNKAGEGSPKSVYEQIINASYPNTPPFPLSRFTSPNGSNRGKKGHVFGEPQDRNFIQQNHFEGQDEGSSSPTTRTILIESNRMLQELGPRMYCGPLSWRSSLKKPLDSSVGKAGPGFPGNPASPRDRTQQPAGRRGSRESGPSPGTGLQSGLGHSRQRLRKSQLDALLQTSADEGRNSESPWQVRAIKTNSSSDSLAAEEQSVSEASCLRQQRPSRDYTPAGRLAEDPVALENKFDLIAAEVRKGLSYLLESKKSASRRQPARPASHLGSELDSLKAELKNLELENKEKDVEIFNLCVHLQDITKITRSLMRRVHRTGTANN